jgi:SAM-dependent methyltransferase
VSPHFLPLAARLSVTTGAGLHCVIVPPARWHQNSERQPPARKLTRCGVSEVVGGSLAKGRESEMPPRDQWESFFDPAAVLESLGCGLLDGDGVEVGCGYGTFTVPAASQIAGTLYALDIDPTMIQATTARVKSAGLRNVVVEQRDVAVDGCGRPDGSTSFVMLFNLLHIENPLVLLREAHRVLRPGGRVGVIHWKIDANTPRGPTLEIRPSRERCRAWGEEAGLRWVRYQHLPESPWHWGMVMERQ